MKNCIARFLLEKFFIYRYISGMQMYMKILGALYCTALLLHCQSAFAADVSSYEHSSPFLFRTMVSGHAALRPCSRNLADLEHEIDREFSGTLVAEPRFSRQEILSGKTAAYSSSGRSAFVGGQERVAPSENDIIVPDNVVAETVVLGVVGLNATQSSGSGGRYSGWVSLEPGTRPAYVGIHGGTAPITLLRSPEGALFAYTGTTGNDFLQILRSRGMADNKTGQLPPQEILSPAPKQSATAKTLASLKNSQTGKKNGLSADPFRKEHMRQSLSEPLLPFGLSNPDGLVLVMEDREGKGVTPLPEKVESSQSTPEAKNLRSYIKLFSDLL